MKTVFILTFIVLSMFSSLSEGFGTLDTCVELNVKSSEPCAVVAIGGGSTHPVTEHKSDCHDSNCYGSAHFGHGFYYSPVQESIEKSAIHSAKLIETFYFSSPISLVHLDGPFRPPLHA